MKLLEFTAFLKSMFIFKFSFWSYHSRIFKRAIKLFIINSGTVSAGNLAFLAMTSLFPFLIFLFAVSGFIGQTEWGLEAVNYMLDALPPEVEKVLKSPIKGLINSTRADLLTVSIVFAIWVASNGLEAARGVLLNAYGWVDQQSLWRRRLESLGLIILAGPAIILSVGLMLITPAFIKAATEFLPSFSNGPITLIISLVSYVIGPLVLLAGVYILYLSLTPRRAEKPYHLPGTLFTALVLLLTARGFSVYLKYADNYDVTYGSLAGVMIAQVFFYIIANGFILGANINAAYAEKAGEHID